jgi:hypothetical protein
MNCSSELQLPVMPLGLLGVLQELMPDACRTGALLLAQTSRLVRYNVFCLFVCLACGAASATYRPKQL